MMFSLLIIVWVLIGAALIFSAADYQSDESFIKSVLGRNECRVGVVLWFLLTAIWLTPVGLMLIYDFKSGGYYWVGTLAILSLPLVAVLCAWRTTSNKGY